MTCLDEDLDKDSNGAIFHSLESVFILFFVLEIVVFKYAFKKKYFENKFNIANAIIVIIIIVLWVLDIAITSYSVSILLRVRASLRLVYIPTIIDHVHHHLKKRRSDGYRAGKFQI